MADLAVPFHGRAWCIGDSVDSEQISGGETGCLAGVHPGFAAGVRPGDLVVAGRNFGCGTHRRAAVDALRACGICAVLAESVARLHLRNSIAAGLPTFTVPGIATLVRDGQRIEIDYPAHQVRNLDTGEALALPALPPGIERILAAGGLLPMLAAHLAARGIVPPDG